MSFEDITSVDDQLNESLTNAMYLTYKLPLCGQNRFLFFSSILHLPRIWQIFENTTLHCSETSYQH